MGIPTSRDQQDPFPSPAQTTETKEAQKTVYRAALKSLRKIDSNDPRLKIGASDYSEAFKGAALFTFRLAVSELMLGQPGKWLELVNYYGQGKWPCGVKENGDIVIL